MKSNSNYSLFLPEWFSLNTDFAGAVFEKGRWRLLYHMLDAETSLEVLHPSFEETDKMFGFADITRNVLWKEKDWVS